MSPPLTLVFCFPHQVCAVSWGASARGASVRREEGGGGTPHTLHPAPCTLHPAPCTLHPAPCTQVAAEVVAAGGVPDDNVRFTMLINWYVLALELR